MAEYIDQQNQITWLLHKMDTNIAVYTHCSTKNTVSLRSITSETDNLKLNHRGKWCVINFLLFQIVTAVTEKLLGITSKNYQITKAVI